MRLQRFAAWCAFLFLMAACAQLGIKTPQSFNERAAAALSTVTASRNAALALLQQKSITAVQAQRINNDADVARALIDDAIALHEVSAPAGETKLEAAQQTIRMLRALVHATEAKGGK